MEFKIEEYNDLYKQQVIDLIVNIQREEFKVAITPDEQPDLRNIPGFYQKDKGNFWLAVTGNTVVGTIALLDIDNNQGALRKMFVSENYRGRQHGVGQALLDKLLEWAKQNGFSEIYLGTTEKFIAAHRFYEKNNFKQVDIPSLPETFPRMAVDVIFYKFNVLR
jgi:GNAT superfamily N-acetyltransferase